MIIKHIKLIGFTAALLVVLTTSLLHTAKASAISQAAQNVSKCQATPFFGLVPWYNYIGNELDPSGPDGHCDVKCFNLLDLGTDPVTHKAQTNDCGQSSSDVPLVLLAVIDDLLRIAGLVAVAFVIYGAFQYVASQGNSDAVAKAQGTVINALIGVVIAISATIFVSFLGKQLGN